LLTGLTTLGALIGRLRGVRSWNSRKSRDEKGPRPAAVEAFFFCNNPLDD